MKKKSFLFLSAIILLGACTHTHNGSVINDYDLDFETLITPEKSTWKAIGDKTYIVGVDSTDKTSGKYSATISYHGDKPKFAGWSMTIANSFEGHKITLTGDIKAKNIQAGYAGLWLRMDPDCGFNNMANKHITNTNGWRTFSITLPLQETKVETIVLGGLLVGSGKVWFDNLRLTVDGSDVRRLQPISNNKLKAAQDTTYLHSSRITQEMLKRFTVKELTDLGEIWGYLKYYHPTLQKGEINWDSELYKLIDSLSKVEQQKRESILCDWIDQLGEYEKTTYHIDKKEVKLLPNLNWIAKIQYSKVLKNKLLDLKDAKRSKSGYYINMAKYIGNPAFTNEQHTMKAYPDAGIRLMAVYRYWNMIEYFCPNRHLIGREWSEILQEAIPRAIDSKNAEEYMLSIMYLINNIHDTHASLASVSGVVKSYIGNRMAIPKVEYIQEKMVVTGYYNDSLAQSSPLMIGDQILSIGDYSVEDKICRLKAVSPASNKERKLYMVARELLRANTPTLQVKVLRNNQEKTFNLNTYDLSLIDIKDHGNADNTRDQLLKKNIAYYDMGEATAEALKSDLKNRKNTKGIVIDLRCYPTDYYAIDEFIKFISPTPSSSYKSSKGSVQQPGLFTYQNGVLSGSVNLNPYKGKVIVLVDESSISAAEFATMRLQGTGHVTVVGTTTAAADGNISRITLPGGLITVISGIGIYYPDGKETQRVGIVPDLKVHRTIKGLIAGEDEILNKAISLIES